MRHFAVFLVRAVAWYRRQSAHATFSLAQDVGTETTECLFVDSIWPAIAISPDDTVFGYCTYCSNYTEPHL